MQHRPIGAFLAAIASVTLIAACGTSDKDQALSLAAKACDVSTLPELHLDHLKGREEARGKILPRLQEDADKAAQAARLDSGWQKLATATDRLAEAVSVTLELETLKAEGGETQEELAKQDRLTDRAQALGSEKAADAVHAECRKTSGS
ncbi:hypothetical protein ACFWVC_27020 [Streptomyces sp. NPDC058691]|uniref:hypothetical protein n=1 Tax=Streptomyces sp. NPDC058691 TaxID=3346601 RepID=UPI0036578881